MASANISHKNAAMKNTGLAVWMERVLKKSEGIAQHWNKSQIHDLRVALRRCRTMADALDEVNPHPGWHKMKASSRGLFHALGDLRDVQIEKSLARKLGAPGDLCANTLSGY